MTMHRFAKNEVLDVSRGDLELCTASGVRLGIHFDTVSGAVRRDGDSWQPVMLFGRNTAEKFFTEKVQVLTDETFSQEEAMRISWRAHSQFHG